ncbi:hypothetical protein SLS64_006027 [Diaporthe eres]|uniref:F-box domain-containing protein n=1 Tax=Diaporthe eres TaxID=83184 RepID=A0ABR1NWV8_DIAER
MASTQDPGSLNRLPDELLLDIIEQSCLSVRDLISLARTSRHNYNVAISPAYEAHVRNELGLAIYWAIEEGQYGTLERLIESGVDVDMLDDDGKPVQIENTLVDNHLDYYWRNVVVSYGSRYSPLALAAYHGQDSMVELLLDNGADIELDSAHLCDCCNLLVRCAASLPDRPGFWEDSDREYGAGHLAWEEAVHDSWWTPLHYAICHKNVSTAKLLLDRGASGDYVGYGRASALHVATRWGVQEVIDYLLEKNLVEIDRQSTDGVTALHLAYIGGNYDLVDKFLDEYGADINLTYTDESGPWSIFAMASADGEFDRALQYLRKGADPNFVIEGEDDQGAWTVMRFIYGSPNNECPSPLHGDDVRIQLEQEIIAGDREETPSDA